MGYVWPRCILLMTPGQIFALPDSYQHPGQSQKTYLEDGRT